MKRNRGFHLLMTFALGLSLGAGSLAAQTMLAHGWFSGPVTEITGTDVRVQGTTLAFSPKTIFVGESPSGGLLSLSATDIQPGDMVTAFAMRPNGVDTATALYRGSAFMVQGQVTSMQMDGQGHPQAIVVDGTYPIAVAQATFNGMSPGAMGSGMGGDMSGGMGSGGMMSGGMGRGMGGGGMMGDPGNPLLLQEGSTVALGGIVENGLYAAVFAHVMASSMQWTGTIHSMTYDKSNNVIGFVMNRSGSGTVVMDAHTRISMHGQGMGGGGSLRIGMQVAVSGLSRHDGSMLAQAVQVQAGHM